MARFLRKKAPSSRAEGGTGETPPPERLAIKPRKLLGFCGRGPSARDGTAHKLLRLEHGRADQRRHGNAERNHEAGAGHGGEPDFHVARFGELADRGTIGSVAGKWPIVDRAYDHGPLVALFRPDLLHALERECKVVTLAPVENPRGALAGFRREHLA